MSHTSGSITVSEVQFIIIMVGAWQCAGRCGARVESATSYRQQEVDCHTEKSAPHNDTLIPARPHLLIVSLALGAIFFPTTTVYIFGCQLDYIWNELQSRNVGHTCKRFSAWFKVDKSPSSLDL